jgi:hypothetical protein
MILLHDIDFVYNMYKIVVIKKINFLFKKKID